jgi:hypothetical protein
MARKLVRATLWLVKGALLLVAAALDLIAPEFGGAEIILWWSALNLE